jgi:hypothetical protein
MTKRLNELAAKHPDKVRRWYHDRDGYWIELQPGWQWRAGHAVHERNVRDALRSFRDIAPCDCDDCKRA